MNTSMTTRKQSGYVLPEDLIDDIKHEAVRQRTYPARIVEEACREYLARPESERKPARN